ncbi:23S rRNA pseudouridine(1911/1915/1917) synthase RluD [Ectothiorhodospiraceae bacterium WFHF3C12]|nr:23S rRNA pseudouridine(1911/1915/1917) synthase RluD [Ectothiorhodospiraceae bacterium WFHF3C12]
MSERIERSATVPDDLRGERFDRVAAALFPEFSRTRLQSWIRAGQITVNGARCKPREALLGGEIIRVEAALERDDAQVEPEAITLDIVHEDEDLLVINKPAGLVVHPGAGNRAGTLQNALLHHAPETERLPRAGLVHRLDKDTSGLLVVARTLQAHKALVDQLQARSMGREYLALVAGTMTAGGEVDAPIGRDPRERKRMAVREDGKPAVTGYRVEERFPAHTLVRCLLQTGRTHQIRVHMAHIRHPLVGDPVYGGRPRLPKGADDALRAALSGFRRQALHAQRLTLTHPRSGESETWAAPLPADMEALLAVLRAHRDAREGRLS